MVVEVDIHVANDSTTVSTLQQLELLNIESPIFMANSIKVRFGHLDRCGHDIHATWRASHP